MSNTFDRVEAHAQEIVKEMLALGFIGGVEDAHNELMKVCQDILDTFREVAVPEGVQFWYHAESESLLTTYGEREGDSICDRDPLVEPVTVEQYREIQKRIEAYHVE